MAEANRAAVRIAANYVRLLVTVCLGLTLGRLLLATLGEDGSGVVMLIGSTVGFAAIIEEVAQWSMIRELGSAHHGEGQAEFRRLFNSALVICVWAGVAILGVFGLILASLSLMKITPELLGPARWFVVAKGIEMAVIVLLAPFFNMYLVLERMVSFNFWFTVRRSSLVAAAVALFWLNPGGDPARGLILYGWLACAMQCFSIGVPVAAIVLRNRLLRPNLALADRAGIRAILGVSRWNTAILSAQTLGIPLGGIIMNLAFGLPGNLIFSYASLLGGYARMTASGMVMGLDAVATRLSTSAGDESVRRLVRHSTALQGLVAFPAVIGIAVLAEPFLGIWVGGDVKNPQEMIPMMAAVSRVLLIGYLVMCICDCWTRILYGSGAVHRYGPAVITGGVVMPGLAVALLALMPESIRYTAVAWAFAMVYLVFYLGFVPKITASVLQMKLTEVFKPLLKPLIAAVVCVPVIVGFMLVVDSWTIWWLGLAAGCYGLAYGALAWFFVLDSDFRARLGSLVGQLGSLTRIFSASDGQPG